MQTQNNREEPLGKKLQNSQKNYIISNMQTEALKSQIEKIAQKHYVSLNIQKFNF